MRHVAAAIDVLRAAGVSDTVILDMVQAMAGVAPEVAPIVQPVVVRDDAADRRRAADRERKKLTPELRSAVLERDGYVCVYCGDTPDEFHIDHVIPVSRGGMTEFENLAASCPCCNLSKHAKTPTEWVRQ